MEDHKVKTNKEKANKLKAELDKRIKSKTPIKK